MADSKKRNAPVCSECNATGHGVQFSIFSKHGFGTYCVECEKKLDAVKKKVRR